MKRLKLNNEEKSRALAVKSQHALLKSAGRDWEWALAAAIKAAQLEVGALNRMRTCGLKIREASGHEQISFDWFHGQNGAIPKSMSFKAMKFCVHLSRRFENPIKTLDEAGSARQMLFEAFGCSSAPKRLEEQVAHEYSPWNDFVSASSSLVSMFKKIELDAMEDWGMEKLSTFLRETEPIVKAHERARTTLQGINFDARPAA